MLILGIDPGTTHSGFVLLHSDMSVVEAGHVANAEIFRLLVELDNPQVAIEMVGLYGTGMAVAKDVFWTCVAIGRFYEASPNGALLYLRQTIKAHLCGNPKAKDGNIRQALADRLGAPGTKKNPGPTYGVTGHCWQALAVAVCHADGVESISPPRKEG